MSTNPNVAVVLVDDSTRPEAVAVTGFLAGYFGSTRRSYATDLRLFSIWCHERNLSLFSVRRAHLELYGRWLEETGRMRSTVARRLSTLASFYKYCEQEQLVDRNHALNVRRPKALIRLQARRGASSNSLTRRTTGFVSPVATNHSCSTVWKPRAVMVRSPGRAPVALK